MNLLRKKKTLLKNANKKNMRKNKIRALEKFCKTRKQNTLTKLTQKPCEKTKQDLLKKKKLQKT